MSKPTVLLVDDHDLVRSVLADELRSAGYELLEAGTGARALELAREHGAIGLIVSDVFLPDMTGPELIEQLELLGVQRVLLTTAYVKEAAALRHASVPSRYRLLEKPVLAHELLSEVMSVLTPPPQPVG